MDEKRNLQRAMSPVRPLRRTRPVVTILFVIAALYTFWLWQPFSLPASVDLKVPDVSLGDPLAGSAVDVIATQDKLVSLEAHIISKCPDTRDALRELILPVMQRVYDKVNFTLSYIGRYDTPFPLRAPGPTDKLTFPFYFRPTSNDGVDCLHGPSECMGNIIELCARELYPDPKINLGFIMCLTRDYENIPDRSLIEDCALEHAIDFQKLNDCAVKDDGGHGLNLLRTSIQRTSDVGLPR
ncbi:hypothetical protein FZEAL_9254 [Fusarium zealandicum]|uniref:Gamma interferon inducible lysosomal thiol reductase n=1 Tax=Fusarium zealandicum TaxID=1053134 RepID=A0A8H4XFY4_9HYPO|nr:hypothetical protein FZEAL_9254 [Fusarium zealandicum]